MGYLTDECTKAGAMIGTQSNPVTDAAYTHSHIIPSKGSLVIPSVFLLSFVSSMLSMYVYLFIKLFF